MKTCKENFKNATQSEIIFLEGFSGSYLSNVAVSEIDSVQDDNEVKELIKYNNDSTNRDAAKDAFLVAWQKFE